MPCQPHLITSTLIFRHIKDFPTAARELSRPHCRNLPARRAKIMQKATASDAMAYGIIL